MGGTAVVVGIVIVEVKEVVVEEAVIIVEVKEAMVVRIL